MSEDFSAPRLPKSLAEGVNLPSFEGFGATVEADPMRVQGAYVLKFKEGDALTTIRIVLNDYSGADLVITNMTTLPPDQTGKGFGGSAVGRLLAWAKENNLGDIRAVQVQDQSESFWIKNGFVRLEGENPTNDFVYKGS